MSQRTSPKGFLLMLMLSSLLWRPLEAAPSQSETQQIRRQRKVTSDRGLQTILLNYNDGTQTYDTNDPIVTNSNGEATGAGTRNSNSASCRVARTDDNNTVLETIVDTTLDYWYEAETVGASPTTDYFTTEVPKGVDVATVYAFADQLCGFWDCILMIHIGVDDKLHDDQSHNCTGMVGDGTCFLYDGDIKIIHADTCNKTEIRDFFVDVMTNSTIGMGSDNFIGTVNERATPGTTDDGSGGSTVVVDDEVIDVRLADPNSSGEDNDPPPVIAGIAAGGITTTQTSVNAGGWAMTALVALLLLLLLGLLLFVRRRSRKRQDKLEDDMQSLHSAWTNKSSDGTSLAGTSFAPSVAKSYMTADMHNLALQHSKLDVHKCKSAMCEICRPNMGHLELLPVSQSEMSTARHMRNVAEIVAEEQVMCMPAEPEPEQRRVPSPPPSNPGNPTPTNVDYYNPSDESDEESGKRMLL
eukprot:CAMPEP_0168742378 /NCGR_PEP_ID=MMETSP0724-20121128/13005_1 /TAXON_ID=265536 /ORGANISM="Amphiprora sp., Strain CCMP467" /LENGTH=468 /DNA_ID=CAMNT_0008789925 /DNA_START=147 /DNA_END=1553 /DNA_ORIENTATION=-